MILRATGALGCFCRFELGNDFVDCGGAAFNRMRNWTAAERAETFPIPREIHFRNGNVLALDIAPDIDFGPIQQRLHADVFAFFCWRYELAPEFRRLILVIP